MSSPPTSCRLYLVTPPRVDLPAFAVTLDGALDGGDVACLQLRLKDTSDDEIREVGRAIQPICHEYEVALLINDRPDLAAELAADGVHIGQEDTNYADARRMVGPDATIGVTCHDSRHLAILAAEQGAEYVAFGAFFPTQTKQAISTADPEILTWWQELMELPCVAIGGITPQNCATLAHAGADFVAVSFAVWGHPQGPKAAVAAFNSELEAAGGGKPAPGNN